MPPDRVSNEGPRRLVVDGLKSSVRAKLVAAGICTQKDLDEEDELQVHCDGLLRQSTRHKGHPTGLTTESTTDMHGLRSSTLTNAITGVRERTTARSSGSAGYGRSTTSNTALGTAPLPAVEDSSLTTPCGEASASDEHPPS